MTLLQDREASGKFAGTKKTALTVELILEVDVPAATIEKIIDKFLEDVPEWAAAQRTSRWSLDVRERGRGVSWSVDSRRIAVALARLSSASSSQQKLRGILPADPVIGHARLVLMNPELVEYLTRHTADVIIQVAVFGELEYA